MHVCVHVCVVLTNELDDVGMVEVLHVGRLLQTLLNVT